MLAPLQHQRLIIFVILKVNEQQIFFPNKTHPTCKKSKPQPQTPPPEKKRWTLKSIYYPLC